MVHVVLLQELCGPYLVQSLAKEFISSLGYSICSSRCTRDSAITLGEVTRLFLLADVVELNESDNY